MKSSEASGAVENVRGTGTTDAQVKAHQEHAKSLMEHDEAVATVNAALVCGGDYQNLQIRSSCPNEHHDWPLPKGYGDASEVANSRLVRKWYNRRCPDCRIYGWVPGVIDPKMDIQVPWRES